MYMDNAIVRAIIALFLFPIAPIFAQSIASNMLSVAHEGSSNYRLEWNSDPSQHYEIQSSSNLITWSNIGIRTFWNDDATNWSLDHTMDKGQTFYRFVEGPIIQYPLLIILMDYSNTQMPTSLIDTNLTAEQAWAKLMFGMSQGEGGDYWQNISCGTFKAIPASESYGDTNNGVIHIWLGDAAPTGSSYTVQNQTWIPDSLNSATNYIDFASYDTNTNGILENTELGILYVINLPYAQIQGAGAEANININYPVNGITIQKFARTLGNYTSIGVNLHELGHHFFGLSHGAWPSEFALMGSGCYNEDPVLTRFTDTNNTASAHWATRPAHMTAYSKILAGFMTPTLITNTTTNVTLYSADHPNYNIIQLPILDGNLYIENRTQTGYDSMLPFATNHSGGLFATEVIVFQKSLQNQPDLPTQYDLPYFYWLDGYYNAFFIGGFLVTNISDAGPKITFDIQKFNMTPAILDYRYEYWINDTEKGPGYRKWALSPGDVNQIDFSEFPGASNESLSVFTFNLDALYNTGEIRSMNHLANWSIDSSYLYINIVPVNSGTDAIIQLLFDNDQTYESNAVMHVTHESYSNTFTFTGLPNFTD